MSRSGYSCDIYDNWELIRWRGAVQSAIRGKRGQKFLRELAGLMDAMPEKKLIKNSLVTSAGVCTLGVVCRAKNIDLTNIDVDVLDEFMDDESHTTLAERLDIADALVREVEFMNDEGIYFRTSEETEEQRWLRMREWVNRQIIDSDK